MVFTQCHRQPIYAAKQVYPTLQTLPKVIINLIKHNLMEDDAKKKKNLTADFVPFFKCNNFTISDKQVELTHITSNLLGPEG